MKQKTKNRSKKITRKRGKVITLTPQMTRNILAVIRSADFVNQVRSHL